MNRTNEPQDKLTRIRLHYCEKIKQKQAELEHLKATLVTLEKAEIEADEIREAWPLSATFSARPPNAQGSVHAFPQAKGVAG